MKNKGLLLVFTTAIISGFSIFINKYSVSVINPYIFTFLKNIIVALILTSVIFLIKDWRTIKSLDKKQWLLLISIGLIGGSIPFLLFFKGLSLTSAAQGSFIHKTMFVYVAIFAAVFLREKIDKNFLLGASLLLIGNFLFLKKLSFSFGRGDILVLAAAILWATENTLAKYVLKDLSGATVAWARMFFGSIFILIFLTATSQTHLVLTLSAKQIIWILITSAFLFGYVITWYNGLKYVPVSIATCILLLGSPITTFLSLAVDGKVNLKEIIAGLVLISGILVILNLRQKIIPARRENYVRA